MPEIGKPNVLGRALHGTDKILNKIMAFVCGIFISAIFFFAILKILNSWGIWGICIGLGLSGAFNVWMKKKYRQVAILNIFNNGVITFNVITAIALIVVVITLFSAIQGALN